jgi:hypothetical protein
MEARHRIRKRKTLRSKVEVDIYPYYINDFAKEIKLSPIVEQKMAARADNVSKAKSLEEKLLEYWKHTGQDIENSGILKKLKQAEVACTTKELLYKA